MKSMTGSSRRRARLGGRRGFTFVHALVLAAIVALGIGLLIPTIERARQRAALALCKDNLRRIGRNLVLYAEANGGELPVSPTIENPHVELLDCLAAGHLLGDPRIYYCPGERRPERSYSDGNFKSGNIGYFYYCADGASDDPALSRFLRADVAWPRIITTRMAPDTWIMSDIWASGTPTAHPGFRKGVNYLMIDGSVDFLGESPRQHFH
jgi:hypothetical protein